MGNLADGESFFESFWPGARAIADPDKELYDALGVSRGGAAEMFGPGAIACGIRAAAKGNFIGPKKGDPWTLPTFVLATGDRIVWRHDGKHAGDHPAWAEIPTLSAS